MSEEPREAAERLLREAHLLRMRKQFAEAEERVRGALELVPEDLDGLDMLAELEYGKGNLEQSRDLCQQILDVDPARSITETRLARITLELAERDQARVTAETLLAGGGGAMSGSERKRRVTISLMLSLLFAGAGQFYNGDIIKGAILAVVYLIGTVAGGAEVLRLMFSLAGARAGPIQEWRLVLGIAALAVWVYGLLDAVSRAQKLSEETSGWQ